MKTKKLLLVSMSALMTLSIASCATNGKDGNRGANGASSYELYMKYHPDYLGNEKEWVEDLANGDLGKKLTIDFHSKGGNKIDSVTTGFRTKITAPANPTRDGYYFDGWYVGDKKINFDTEIFTTSPAIDAKWVRNEDNDSIVGSLSIVGRYTDGASFTYGHSFLVYTSYVDDNPLTFNNLFGYYTYRDEFKQEVMEDENNYLWTSSFEKLFGPEGTYTGVSEEEKAEIYSHFEEYKNSVPENDWDNIHKVGDKSLYDVLLDYDKEHCFVTHPADDDHSYDIGTDNRYRRIGNTFDLKKGEFITIGNFNMVGSATQAASDAITKSEAYDILKAELEQIELTDSQKAQIITKFIEIAASMMLPGEKDFTLFIGALKAYLATVISEEAVTRIIEIIMAKGPDAVIGGDTRGGLFVNGEAFSQKRSQNKFPNAVYTVDITKAELNDMLNFLNVEENDQTMGENHYSLVTHNCAAVATNAWNQALGYVRDINGDNTLEKSDLYLDGNDETYFQYGNITNVAYTPKKVKEVITKWDELDLRGKASFDVQIIKAFVL